MKFNSLKSITLLSFLLTASVAANAEAPAPVTGKPVEAAEPVAVAPAPAAAPAPKRNSDQCITHEAAIEDMRKRRDELELKAKEISARESELAAREKALEEELKKIGEIRDDVAKIENVARTQNEEKVSKIVETVEAMSPKAAAKLIASLDERLAVSTIERLSTPRLAKIMNLMEPETSSRLNEVMAGVARARGVASKAMRSTSSDVAAASTIGKGGGTNERNNNDTSVRQQSGGGVAAPADADKKAKP